MTASYTTPRGTIESSFPRFKPFALSHRIAESTASPHVLAALTVDAIERNDAELARQLESNGMLRADCWSQLTTRFPNREHEYDLRVVGVMPAASDRRWCTYESVDVEQLIESGEAPPHRMSELFEEAAISYEPELFADLTRRLLDSGDVPDWLVTKLSERPDRHAWLSFTTHPNARHLDCRFTLAVDRLTHNTHMAVGDGIDLPPATKLVAWSQLPNLDDMPFELTPAQELIDGRMIETVTLRVPKTPRELKALSKAMHNCLDGYVDDVADGWSLVAFGEHADEIYAVMWEVDNDPRISEQVRVSPSPRLRVQELNSKFNRKNVPDWFKSAIDQLTVEVCSDLETLENEPPDLTEEPWAGMDIDPTDLETTTRDGEVDERIVVRRPPKRIAVPPLSSTTSTSETPERQGRVADQDPPSLLGVDNEIGDLTEEGALPIDTRPDTPAVRHDKSSAPQLDSGL